MKFGKNLLHEKDSCDPEWGPYWMNYKFLKKKLNVVATELSALKQQHQLNPQSEDRSESMNSSSDLRGLGSIDGRMLVSKEDRDFFKDVMKEMKKTSFFFDSSERSCLIRRARILAGIKILKGEGSRLTKSEWTRMLTACVRFYKDAVLIENYAVLHLAGFSKIIKKHDKITGFQTKEIFLRNVVSRQNFVRHSFFTTLLSESEALFNELRGMESAFTPMDGRGLFRPAAQALSQDKESVKEQEVKRASSAGKELSQQIIVRPLECTTSAGQSEESTASRPLKKRIIAVDGLHLGLKTTGSEETTLEPI